MPRHRPYGAADTLSRCLRPHFYVEIVDRVPLPRCGGGGRGKGPMRLWLPLERICAQYGVRFFFPEKSKFVASTAKRQRGLQRGKPGSPLPCFASFCRSKRKAPAASGANYAFVKGSVTPTGDHNLGLIFLLPTFLHRKVPPGGEPYRLSPSGDSAPPKATANPAPAASGANYAFPKGPAPPAGDYKLAPA